MPTFRATSWSRLLPLLLALAGFSHEALAQETANTRRDFSTNPPLVKKAVARLLAQPVPAGNARVEVIFAAEEVLPPQIPVFLERSKHLLRDDGREGDAVAGDRKYSAIVPLDLDAIARQQQRVHRLQEQHGRLAMPVYQGRKLVRRTFLPADFFRPLQPEVPFPLDWWAFPAGVSQEHSLVIRDPSVVEDPTRTYDPCTDTGTPMGKWTFGYLMQQMANQAYTGLDPAEFARQWTLKMLTPQVVNGWTVNLSAGTDTAFNAWPRVFGTKQLDLAKAPFKLLAIVNRVDLRNSHVYGGGNGGEARFVFGLLGCPGSSSPGLQQKFTVILEYGIQTGGCLSLKNWAQQWTALGDHALGSAAYNAALEAITDQFSLADAAPNKPNRSALNQLRTNRGQVDALWELREFKLHGKGAATSHLMANTVAQTPASEAAPGFGFLGYPNPDAVIDYIDLNETAILTDKHVVPNFFAGIHFRGGSSTRLASFFGWDSALITNREARHKFALQTCNGCHFNETGLDSNPNMFFHIAPANVGATAALSGFMTGTDVPDPFDDLPVRHFDELERRATDLDGLANNICLTALDTRDRKLIPMTFAH